MLAPWTCSVTICVSFCCCSWVILYIYEILRKLRICLSYSYLSFVLCSPHHSSELKGCNVWHDFYLLNDLGNLTGTAVYLFSVYLHKVFIVSHLFPY